MDSQQLPDFQKFCEHQFQLRHQLGAIQDGRQTPQIATGTVAEKYLTGYQLLYLNLNCTFLFMYNIVQKTKGLVKTMTNVSIPIPDDVMQRLKGQWTDIPRHALEALAIEAYRVGILTSAEVQRMLNLRSRWETDTLLKRAQAYLDYTEADLEQDIQTLERLSVAT